MWTCSGDGVRTYNGWHNFIRKLLIVPFWFVKAMHRCLLVDAWPKILPVIKLVVFGYGSVVLAICRLVKYRSSSKNVTAKTRLYDTLDPVTKV